MPWKPMLSNFQWNNKKKKKKNKKKKNIRTPIYMRAARILEQEGFITDL